MSCQTYSGLKIGSSKEFYFCLVVIGDNFVMLLSSSTGDDWKVIINTNNDETCGEKFSHYKWIEEPIFLQDSGSNKAHDPYYTWTQETRVEEIIDVIYLYFSFNMINISSSIKAL